MKTLIWDYNGTIVDDTQLCLDIENKMLAEHHLPHPFSLDEYKNLFCFPVRKYYEKLGYDLTKVDYDQLAVEFHELYDAGFHNCKLVDGFYELLEKSKKMGYQNVILSASKTDKLKHQCDTFGISKHFVEILGVDDLLAESKVEMAKRWMKKAELDPSECIYVGDTTHDKETAEAIGVSAYTLVACGHQSFDVLKNSGAKNVVHRLDEVIL